MCCSPCQEMSTGCFKKFTFLWVLVINEKIPEVWIKYLLIWHSYWYHCGFLEHWNSQKSLTKIRQCFSCLLDEGIEKIWKKKFTMDFWDNPIYPISNPKGQEVWFFRGKCWLSPLWKSDLGPVHLVWISDKLDYLKNPLWIFFCIFFQSPHQVDMKNIGEFW